VPVWKSALRWGSGLALAVLLIAWVLRGVDLVALREELGRASVAGLAAGAALNLGHNAFRVWRWRVLLAPVRARVPFSSLLSAVILGYAATWVLPGRVGEFVRPALLAGRENLPLGPCLGSVLADRLLDGACVLVLFGVGLFVAPPRVPLPGLGTAAWGVLLVAGLAVFLLVVSRSRGRDADVETRRGVAGWLARAARSLGAGLGAVKEPRLLARVVVLTAAAWAMIAAGTWVGVRACGVDLAPAAVPVLLPLLVLGIALPTPGGAGGYHAAMKFGLVQLCLVPEPAAVGAGILMHAAIVLPVLGAAALLLALQRAPLGQIRDALARLRDLGAAGAGPGGDGA